MNTGLCHSTEKLVPSGRLRPDQRPCWLHWNIWSTYYTFHTSHTICKGQQRWNPSAKAHFLWVTCSNRKVYMLTALKASLKISSPPILIQTTCAREHHLKPSWLTPILKDKGILPASYPRTTLAPYSGTLKTHLFYSGTFADFQTP